VAAETELGAAAKPFSTGAVVGFVSDQSGVPVAVSGACTHLGCLLRMNAPAGRLDCPCHRTAFSYDGKVISFELPAKPPPLPRIQARRNNGSIEVLVPPPA
jgi:Rieske Fe-S protein